MADEAELYYLQPDFDLNTLTIPRLRSILVAHNINYPSSAKKAELVQIIQDELLPQAQKLIKEARRVRRTSKGITNIPSSQESTMDGYDSDDRELMPPPPAFKTPRGRKSKSNLSQDEIQPTPRTAGRSKTPSGRKSIARAKTPRMSDTETEPEKTTQSSRRTRKSIPGPVPVVSTPAVRLEDAKDKRKSLEDGESPFTQDNPFQQASSPSSDPQERTSSSRTRKSIGSTSTRKSLSRRREPDTRTTKRESIAIPVSHLSTGVDGIETTEEFTEDAREELSREMTTDRKLVKARNKDVVRYQKKPQSTVAKTAPWAILTTVLAATAGWYRQEKVAIGYCGIGKPNWSLAAVDGIPSWFHDSLQPQCEPCPQHATCYENMEVVCDHDFVLKQHPLNLNGVVPLSPTCEPDSEKERRVKQVADKAINELRNRRAAYECGDDLSSTTLTSDTSTPSSLIASSSTKTKSKLEVEESTLKATLAHQRTKKMSEAEFEDLWSSALGDIKSRDEVEVIEDK